MNVNPGELDKRIRIMEQTGMRDEDGYKQTHPEPVHTCWARFTQTSGTELVRANADFSEVKVRFLIRYTKKPISRKMVIQFAGAEYEIVYINHYGDGNEYMEIWCTRLTREG